ncbi:MAG: enoyl-CoA hydratase [Bacteroidota bacterium]
MDYQEIEYERLGPIARIWHNRPHVRNAESQRLLDEMDDAVRAAVGDPDVRVIVLAGKGEHFSAGHDLKEAQAKRSAFTVEQRYAYEERRYFEYCLRIWDAPKPTIAQVQGACVAGAFMVANMCDLIVASDDAFFADPVVHTLGAASVEVLIHPWVLGMRRAKEMLFTGERVSAGEAWRLGMVNRVVPRADLDQAVLALANRIAQSPPFALKILKKSMHTTADIVGLRAALTAHFDTHQLSHVSSEFVQIRDRGLAGAIQKGGPRSGQ